MGEVEAAGSLDEPLELPPALCRIIPELRELSEYFRCRVCYNFCSDPVSTPCSHNFCSVCIRKYLLYKSQCPECFSPVHEPELRPNRALREVMLLLIKTILPRIQKVQGDGKINFRSKDATSSAISSTPMKDGPCAVSTPKAAGRAPKTMPVTPKSTAPVTSKTTTPKMAPPKPEAAPVETVGCPVCSVDVPKVNINLHLDRCLNESKNLSGPSGAAASSSSGSPSAGTSGSSGVFALNKPKMKPVQKVVYHLMKESELRKKLKDEGLDTKGDKKTLIQRHQRFAVLWNAQCQSDKPLSRLQIRMQVSKEEQAEKKEQAQTLSTRSNLLDYDRKTDQGVIDEKQKEYIKANKSSFDKLVEEVRKRKMAMKKPPSLPPPLDEEEERELEEDQKSDASLSILDGHDLDNVSIRSQDDMFNTSGASSLANAVAQVTIKQGSNNKSPKPISTAKEFPKSPAVAPSAKSTNVVAINTPGGGKSKKKTGGVSQLYVTPKRKSSEELSEDCKRFRQNSITSSMLSSQKKAEQQQQPKKNSWNCPVCAKAVSVNYVNVHLDRCLRDKDSENNSSVASKAAKKKIRQKLSKKKSPKALFDNNSDDDFVDSQKIEDTDSEEEEEDEDGNPVLSKVMPPRSQRVRKAKESAKYNEDESSQVAEENDLEGIKKIPEEDDVDNIIDDFIDDFVENVDEPISATEIKKKDLNRNVEPNPASEKISTVDDDEELMEKENKEEDSDLIVLETIPPVNPDDPKGKRTVKGVGGKKSKRKDVGPDNANAGKKQPTSSSSTSSSQQQQQPQPLKSSRRLKAKDLLNKDWS